MASCSDGIPEITSRIANRYFETAFEGECGTSIELKRALKALLCTHIMVLKQNRNHNLVLFTGAFNIFYPIH